MSRRQPQAEVEPVVQRLRIRYAKRGRLRFASHRDFARALERAVRRAGIPVAHSAGFSPHPKISYIGAAPTGAASEAEYAELGLRREVDPDRAREVLDSALPAGMDVLECVVARDDAFAGRVDASAWRIELPGVGVAAAADAVAALLGCASVPVQRRTKSGRRSVDVRAAIVSLAVATRPSDDATAPPGGAPDGPAATFCAILEVVVRHTTPAVRPDDVLAALRAVADLVPSAPARAVRLAQGRLGDDGRLADPFEPDRLAGQLIESVAAPAAGLSDQPGIGPGQGTAPSFGSTPPG